MIHPAGISRDERRLGDEESSRDACALSIVFDVQVGWDMRFVCAETSQRGEDNTMAKL